LRHISSPFLIVEHDNDISTQRLTEYT